MAGTFYPAEPRRLEEIVRTLLGRAPAAGQALGVMSPHAGYVYSGGVAARTLGAVAVPPAVVVLCPNHTGMGARAGVWPDGSWVTPLGEVTVDRGLTEGLLAASSLLRPDTVCHLLEHSIEVQLPFLLARRPAVRIAPVCLSMLSYEECEEAGQAVARVVGEAGGSVLVLASCDMNHYLPEDVTRARDRLAIDRLLALDPRGLHETVLREDLSMCGFVPATVMLVATRALGAREATLVDYDTSATASGDRSRVVGYAGIVVA